MNFSPIVDASCKQILTFGEVFCVEIAEFLFQFGVMRLRYMVILRSRIWALFRFQYLRVLDFFCFVHFVEEFLNLVIGKSSGIAVLFLTWWK